MTWLSELSGQIARTTGLDANTLALSDTDADTLLRLAGLAAHESGERTNAPLLCHLLGRAVALGTPLDELAHVVEAALAERPTRDGDGAH
jgi:hypothetical protein